MSSGTRVSTGLVVVAGIVASIVGVVWLDRPLADFSEAHGWASLLSSGGEAARTPLRYVLFGLVAAAALVGASLGQRRHTAAGGAVLMECAWAGMVALLLSIGCQLLLGRSQLDPLYLHGRIYAFRPFGGTAEYMALPCATIAMAAAAAGVAWKRSAPARGVVVAALVLLSVGMVVFALHWFSDVASGVVVGALATRSAVPSRAVE